MRDSVALSKTEEALWESFAAKKRTAFVVKRRYLTIYTLYTSPINRNDYNASQYTA